MSDVLHHLENLASSMAYGQQLCLFRAWTCLSENGYIAKEFLLRRTAEEGCALANNMIVKKRIAMRCCAYQLRQTSRKYNHPSSAFFRRMIFILRYAIVIEAKNFLSRQRISNER